MAKVVRKSNSKNVLAKIEKLKNRAVSAAIKEAAETMHRLVPKRTGNLDSTIEATDDGNGNGKIEVGADNGIYVEFGTTRASAQPFFRPGLDAGRRKLRSELKNG